jgi:hypothetical protein
MLEIVIELALGLEISTHAAFQPAFVVSKRFAFEDNRVRGRVRVRARFEGRLEPLSLVLLQ